MPVKDGHLCNGILLLHVTIQIDKRGPQQGTLDTSHTIAHMLIIGPSLALSSG